MESSRIVLIVFLILFIILSPDGERTNPDQLREVRTLLQQLHGVAATLNGTHAGDFDPNQGRWLNATGLRSGDGYAWELLPAVQGRARKQAYDVLETKWIETYPNFVKSVDHASFGPRYESVVALDGGPVGGPPAAIRAVPFYRNITGVVHGQWMRSRLAAQRSPTLNLTALSSRAYTTREYGRNVTGSGGDVFITFDEKQGAALSDTSGTARGIKAEMSIQDGGTYGESWDLTLHGIHFQESGSVLLSTTSDKFAGLFALPHFLRSAAQFDVAQRFLSHTLIATIRQWEESGSSTSLPWSSSPNRGAADVMFPTPNCEYLVYLQQHFVWPYAGPSASVGRSRPSDYLKALEAELRTPTELYPSFVPELKFSAVIFSPDCGFVLESKGPPEYGAATHDHLAGLKAEAHYTQIRRLVEVFSLLVAGQIWLLIRQMKDASTPSTRSRISYQTIAVMALGDGFIFLIFMALSMFMDAVYLTVVATSFLSFLCVSFFGMKFLMDVWSVQAPERLEQERERERANANAAQPPNTAPSTEPSAQGPPAVVITPAGADTLPLPATAPRPQDTGASPIIILPPDQDIDATIAEDEAATPVPNNQTTTTPTTTTGSARREMGALYSKFYFLLVGLLFLSLNATTWPPLLRSIYARILATLYLSIWWPQIRRNALRNCRRALRWEFVLGQSALRLAPCAYVALGLPGNVFFLPPDYPTLGFLVAWVWLQILLLASQEALGPRFFVPAGWAPPAYDYHPVLKEDEEEAIVVGGAKADERDPDSPVVEGAADAPERGKKRFDCAICMQVFEVPVVPRGGREADVGGATALGAGLFGRRAYMVTPCRHVFHSACLEGWMRYKLQCPICRESLPPL